VVLKSVVEESEELLILDSMDEEAVVLITLESVDDEDDVVLKTELDELLVQQTGVTAFELMKVVYPP
jgi:hypothetical protein